LERKVYWENLEMVYLEVQVLRVIWEILVV
jgi:hypothetical protein